ncbi:MAG TPA: tetratricopeptide repeat protein [Chloroflexota bacterium]|nr:tetratricopeptide repeat protein [Chloroflexota bacterium]
MQSRPEARAASSFGAQVRTFRTRAGLSQEALASRAGLGVATLKALERDQRQRPHPRTVALLAEALGLAVTERAILLDLASGQVSVPIEARPPSPGAAAPRSDAPARLPVPPTGLIGRDLEVAEISALLASAAGSARLVTLVGPGGVGKTRLVVAVAAGLASAYPDGIVFVDLAPLSDPRLVSASIARALGVAEGSGLSARDLVFGYLHSRQALLVLDNFEHLLEARPLVLELLHRCPRVALLVTTRAALRLQGERRVLIGPLATPAPQDDDSVARIEMSPAVRLFVERARAVVADFSLTSSNAAAVGNICRRLDGLPLAIELAAARVPLLAPATLLSRLKRRLVVLTGGGPDLPRRQQTLRATLEWSVALLEPTERALFRRLAVFAGGWSVDAAEAVAADALLPDGHALDGLQALVDVSLIYRLRNVTSEPRFAMLETVREYALEQLEAHGETTQQCRRHTVYCLALAERAEPELRGADQRIWFDRLDRELDNLRTALAWARSSDEVELGLRLAVALAVFCEERGHVGEGCDWLAAFVQQRGTRDAAPRMARLHARALAISAWLTFLQGHYERAAPLAEESLARWRQLGEVGNSPLALNALAYVARRDDDQARQDARFRQSLALTRAEGDRHGTAAILSWLGTQQRAAGDLDGATALLEESLQLYQTTGTVGGIAYVLLHLGGVARARQDTDRAQALFELSLALYDSLGDRSDVAYATGALAALAADDGDFSRARRLCGESIATFRQLGDVRGLTEELRVLGRIARLQGDDRSAAAAFAECLKLGHALRRVDLAFSLEGLAMSKARIATREPQPGRLPLAVRLLGAADALRKSLGTAAHRNWSVAAPEVTHPEYEQQVADIRAALGDAAFAAAWSAGRRLSLDEAKAEALAAG